MAIDPNILLQNVAPDIGQALLRGVSMGTKIKEQQRAEQLQAEKIKESQLQQQSAQQKLEQANREAEILRVGVTAQKLMPYIKNKDIAGFKQNLANSGLPTADIEEFSALADNNAWDSIQSVADQGIQIARDTGVFGKDYSGSGYTSSPIQVFQQRNQLQNAVDIATNKDEKEKAQAQLDIFDNIVRQQQLYALGGGLYGARQPITGDVSLVPTVPTKPTGTGTGTGAGTGTGTGTGTGAGTGAGAGAGAGAGRPPSPQGGPPAGGAAVDLNAPIDTAQTPEEAARLVAEREAKKQFAVETATLDAKEVAKITAQVNDTRANFARYAGRFKKQGIDILQTLKDAPQTGMGGVLSRYSSLFINGLSSESAKAKLEPLFQDMVKIQPFPPGAQSLPEQQAREKAIGDILSDGRLSPEDKYQMITDYFDGINAEAKERWNILNETRVENGLKPLKTPYDEGMPFGAPKPTPQEKISTPAQPSATPQKWFYDKTTGTYKKSGG